MLWQLRMGIFTMLVKWATWFLPKDAIKTLQWLYEMPWEDKS